MHEIQSSLQFCLRKLGEIWKICEKRGTFYFSPIPAPCCDSLAHLVNPKTWLLCSESRQGGAASSTISSLIWTVWLLHAANCSFSPGFSLKGGEYTHPGAFQQAFGKAAVCALLRCTVWRWFGFFPPSLWAGKATALFSRHTKAIVWGMQTRAVQGMLDFDYICSRDEPSVAAMVYPFT